MGLDTPGLKAALKGALSKVRDDPNKSAEQQLEEQCDEIAMAFEAYVKSGDVNVTVQTTGTAAAQSGTGTGKVI